jgi:hypothetical protein
MNILFESGHTPDGLTRPHGFPCAPNQSIFDGRKLTKPSMRGSQTSQQPAVRMGRKIRDERSQPIAEHIERTNRSLRGFMALVYDQSRIQHSPRPKFPEEELSDLE